MERWILSGNHRRRSGNNDKKKNHFLLVTPLTRAGTGKTYASAFALRSEKPEKESFLDRLRFTLTKFQRSEYLAPLIQLISVTLGLLRRIIRG